MSGTHLPKVITSSSQDDFVSMEPLIIDFQHNITIFFVEVQTAKMFRQEVNMVDLTTCGPTRAPVRVTTHNVCSSTKPKVTNYQQACTVYHIHLFSLNKTVKCTLRNISIEGFFQVRYQVFDTENAKLHHLVKDDSVQPP